MKTFHKVLFISAALMLLALFIFPMWKITLVAPQYPKGVTMYIWINKISGSEPGTLQNINILNHYVGMKKIIPESIPELQYFPYVILAMTFLGVVFGFIGKRSLWIFWFALLAVLCIAGIYDFYLWEYDYGHNLSPDAPIKVPGMAYQPPVIGNKVLLNFLAKSWPWIGGWFVGLSFLLSGLAIWLSGKKSLKDEKAKSVDTDNDGGVVSSQLHSVATTH